MRGRNLTFVSINLLLQIGILVVFVLIVLSTISSWQASAQRVKMRMWVMRSYAVQTQIERTVSALHEANAMERDAVLHIAIGSPVASPPSSRSHLPKVIAETTTLVSMTADNPLQQQQLNALNPQVAAYENRVKSVLADCRTHPKRVLAQFPRNEDASRIDAMLKILKRIDQNEERLLQRRLDTLNVYTVDSETVLLYVRLLVLLAVMLVYAGVSRIAREKEGLVMQLGESNRRLESLATTDFLTGLNNQGAYFQKVEGAFEQALFARVTGNLSLIVLDVDHFKQYNDSYGHPAGDVILEAVGSLLKSASRPSDFAARSGGEEFSLLLPNTTSAEALGIAEGVRKLIESYPWSLRPITVSIGVATLRPEMESSDAIVTAADLALYTSKRNGRNRVCHFDDFDAPPRPAMPSTRRVS